MVKSGYTMFMQAKEEGTHEERKVVGSVYSIYAYHQKLSIYFGRFVGTVFQQAKFR
jgi:hypothetical protein